MLGNRAVKLCECNRKQKIKILNKTRKITMIVKVSRLDTLKDWTVSNLDNHFSILWKVLVLLSSSDAKFERPETGRLPEVVPRG